MNTYQKLLKRQRCIYMHHQLCVSLKQFAVKKSFQLVIISIKYVCIKVAQRQPPQQKQVSKIEVQGREKVM